MQVMDDSAQTEGSYRAADIIRLDLLEIAELESPEEMIRRMTALCLTAKGLNEGTLRMLAEVNRA